MAKTPEKRGHLQVERRETIQRIDQVRRILSRTHPEAVVPQELAKSTGNAQIALMLGNLCRSCASTAQQAFSESPERRDRVFCKLLSDHECAPARGDGKNCLAIRAQNA